MRDEELLNGPALAGAFPIKFKNGFTVNTLLFWCPACNAAAPLTKVHGYISRLVEGVADITAATKCACGEITGYRIRLRDNRTFAYLEDGAWVDKTTVMPFWKRALSGVKAKILIYRLRWKYYQLKISVRKLHKTLKKMPHLRHNP